MLNLLPQIESFLTEDLSTAEFKRMAKIRQDFSDFYRSKSNQSVAISAESARCYAVYRMPAILSVITDLYTRHAALFENIESVLDLGAGPGTVSWGLFNQNQNLKITQVEKELAFVKISKRMGKAFFPDSPLSFVSQHIHPSLISVPKHDLSVLSFVINEINPETRLPLYDALIKKTEKMILMIEPGTPEGFGHLREARIWFESLGWHSVGPCTHTSPCPLAEDDWCHFRSRVPRSKLMNTLKGGHMAYEDEKYAYLLLSPDPSFQKAGERIIRHPLKHKGHIQFLTCAEKGIEKETVTRKDPRYKRSRKLNWGDAMLDI